MMLLQFTDWMIMLGYTIPSVGLQSPRYRMNDWNESPDRDIVMAIRQSNDLAFRVLYYRYYEMMFAFVIRRISSLELSKDFIQELFTRLWHHRESLDENKSIKAYLYRIANNLIIDYLRRKNSEHIYLNQPHKTGEESRIELKMDIEAAIGNLPVHLRTVFMMSRYDGLKYAEIADVLDISIKTVEKRIGQALLRLRRALG